MTNHACSLYSWMVAVLVLTATGFADTVALKTFARVAPSSPVSLGDVAELSGTEAESLRSVAIVQDSGQAGASMTIDLLKVREALKSLPKLNLGRISLSGSTCTVRVGLQ